MNYLNHLNIVAACFQEDGKFVWFCPEGLNALCKYDLKLGKIVHMQVIPGDGSYKAIEKYEKKLILIPYGAENVCVYDIDQKTFIVIELQDKGKKYFPRFVQGVRKGNCVYLVPVKYPHIVRINMDTMDFVQGENLVQICRMCSGRQKSAIVFTASAYDGDNVLYLSFDSYYVDQDGEYTGDLRIGICRISLDKFQIKVKMLDNLKSDIKGLVCYGGKLFSYAGEGRIIVLNNNMDTVEIISDIALCDNKNPWEIYVDRAFIYGDKIVLIRRRGLKALILNPNGGNAISKIGIIDEWIRCVGIMENGLLIQPVDPGYFYVVEKGKCIKKFWKIENEILQNFLRKTMIDYKNVWQENAIIQLPEWMWIISCGEKSILQERNNGEIIYKNMRLQ